MEICPGVTMDPHVRFGKPCLSGTRLDVATIVAAIGAGETPEAMQQEYRISHEQLLAALRYARACGGTPPASRRQGS